MFAVRQADLSDIPQIRKVASETWLATYRELYPLEFIQHFLSRAYSKDSLSRSIERDHLEEVPLFLVAVQDNEEIIGYAHVQPVGDQCYELMRLYVHPNHQRSGAGSMLLHQYFTTLTMLRSMFAWVERDNAIGRAFYERKGFVEAEELLETLAGYQTMLVKYELHCDRGGLVSGVYI